MCKKPFTGLYFETMLIQVCDTILVPIGTRMIRHVNKGYVGMYVCMHNKSMC